MSNALIPLLIPLAAFGGATLLVIGYLVVRCVRMVVKDAYNRFDKRIWRP